MNRTVSRPARASLLTRISDAKTQASTTVDRSYHERPRQESFAEQYRGTEYASPAPVMAAPRETDSRGRTFVLIAGTASLSMIGMLLVAAAG